MKGKITMLMTVLTFIIMILCAGYDIRTKKIPLILIAAAGFFSLVEAVTAFTDGIMTLSEILYTLIPGLALLLLAFAAKNSVGYGDGMLIAAIGPALGLKLVFSGTMMAFFFSSVAAVILLALKKADRKSKLPFVPFLTTAVGVMYFVV